MPRARLHRQIVMRRASFPSSDCEPRREEERRGKKPHGSKNNSRKQRSADKNGSNRRMRKVFAKGIASMNSSVTSCCFIYTFSIGLGSLINFRHIQPIYAKYWIDVNK